MNISVFTKNDRFFMLALDHRESFRKILNRENPQIVKKEEIIEIKSEIIESLSQQFTGFLIDVEYGLPAYKSLNFSFNKPFLLAAEKTGYQEKDGERITQLEYEVEELKNLGASGIKLLLYFNPYSPLASFQIQTAKKILKQCHFLDIPFFLEIVTYHNETSIKKNLNLVIESIKRFLSESIRPSVFKLEYPGNEENCRKLTEILKSVPWILLTRGENFEIFKLQLKAAVKNGCQGFLAGRALWQEIGECKNKEERKAFLNIVKKRFQEIISICESEHY